jgi:hypothetical protein
MLYGNGFWGVGGKAYTDEELRQELEKASPDRFRGSAIDRGEQ